MRWDVVNGELSRLVGKYLSVSLAAIGISGESFVCFKATNYVFCSINRPEILYFVKFLCFNRRVFGRERWSDVIKTIDILEASLVIPFYIFKLIYVSFSCK